MSIFDKMTTEFSLFISHFFNFSKHWILNSTLFSLKKWKMNMQFHFSFSTFRKKGWNECRSGISFKQWSFVSFPDVDVIQFNSRTLEHSAYWRQTDEIVCSDGNIRVPFNKGLFFVFLTCIFQKAWITNYVESWEAFKKSRFDEVGGVLCRNSIPCGLV